MGQEPVVIVLALALILVFNLALACAKLPPLPSLPAWLLPMLGTHTHYCRLALDGASSRLRRAPGAGQRPRGWLLVHSHKGEDIHGRPIDLMSSTYVRVSKNELPRPWPNASAICVRLLSSGSIKDKEWWTDLSRATGGRLRAFELAAMPASECEAEYSGAALALFTVAASLLASLTVRLSLGPAVRNYVEVSF